MPWCPNCRSEYDKNVKFCNDCQCELRDDLPPKMQTVRELFLLTVADEMEFRIVEAKLSEYRIPIIKRYRGAGAVTQIYMGRTFGLDVYVPEAFLSQAKEILEKQDFEQNNEAEQTDEQSMDLSRRGSWGRKILLVFIIMILTSLGLLTVIYLISFLSLL